MTDFKKTGSIQNPKIPIPARTVHSQLSLSWAGKVEISIAYHKDIGVSCG